ncbi:MAG: FAD-dependent oxidoreductase [Zoogloeaceae bacterium]|jgi:dimethylamine/trimethylamine dehydrogenase|nr:FAD-dependent oxidoreductase [Zoogloeaceae bacterium]
MARDPKYDILFEPIKIGPKTSRNRFFQSSHCAGPGSERPGTQAAMRGMKAEGGWGVVFTEYCSIHPESDEYPWTSARIWDEGDVINLRHMCDVAHQYKSLAGVQLWYGGIHSPNLESRETGRAPSGLASNMFPSRSLYASEMDGSDILAVQNMYLLAARRAEQAGFDLLEVSGGDSTIPIQFLEPRYNLRTDKYGGSLENRARFYIELMTKLKREFGDRCAITTRFELDTLHGAHGIEAKEDGVRFVEMLNREGVCDLWSVKIGDYEEWGEDAGASRYRKSGWMVPFVKEAKRVVGNTPVVVNGRFTSPDDMVAILRSGVADIIGAARPSIADPFLPNKIDEGRLEDIRECIGCNMCVSKFNQCGQMQCTQNQTAMEEYRRGWHPEKFDKTKQPCSVLVVGAGPAGMECARVLGERGYDVHLREAEEEVGGHWKWVSKLPRLNEWSRVITYRQLQLSKMKNVEVHLGVGRMTATDVLEYGADRVVIATGSHWSSDGVGAETHRPIPGADASLPHIFTPEQIVAGKPIVGKRVLVVDGEGHFLGITLAEMMADLGKEVTYVTNMSEVADYGVFTLEVQNNKRMLNEKKIVTYRNHWPDQIAPGKVTLGYMYRYSADLTEPNTGSVPRRLNPGTVDLEIDSVILVTSRVSHNGLYKELKQRKAEWAENEIQDIYQIGDGKAPMQALQAMFEGHRLAREFDSPHPAYPLPWIRERQIWGHDTLPKLGDERPKVEVD